MIAAATASITGEASTMSPAATAMSLKRFANRFPRVKQLIWFMLRDEPLEKRGQSDKWQSGLRDVNGAKKPSYNAWVQTIQQIL